MQGAPFDSPALRLRRAGRLAPWRAPDWSNVLSECSESKDSLAHGPGGYIGGAELEISSGARAGRKTIADPGGFFRIEGLQAPGFDVTVREAGYSSKRFHVSELGRDLSSET